MAGPGHSARGHAKWSASSSARLWGCPGSLKLVGRYGAADVESEAAAWGTACHEVSEACIRNGQEAVEWIGRFIATKSHTIEVDEELAETAQTYIDYVMDASVFGVHKGLWIEQTFSLDKLKPPFEAGGTSDAVIYHEDDKMLEVVDLKGGRGVRVEAKENKQARTYGVGAVLHFPHLDVDKIKITIVQPRMEHPDGRIRSETISYLDLMDWTAELQQAWKRAHQAEIDFTGSEEDADNFQLWAGVYLKAGSHCQFCPAAGGCPALAEKAEREAQTFFRDESGAVQVIEQNKPDRLNPEQLARVLDHADMIQNWLNSVRAYAQREAESGVEIPRYQLVQKHGREKWNDDDAALAAAELCDFLGIEEDAYRIAPKLRTPKQVRKALGKQAVLLDGMSSTPKLGLSLTETGKTTRPAVKPPANKFFTVIDD